MDFGEKVIEYYLGKDGADIGLFVDVFGRRLNGGYSIPESDSSGKFVGEFELNNHFFKYKLNSNGTNFDIEFRVEYKTPGAKLTGNNLLS